jgi:hypothetical protein
MATCTADPREAIGSGVSIERRYIDGEFDGLAYWHPDGKGGVCEGYIYFREPGDKDGWTLVSEKPLTVAPSLLCRACQHHGFIRGGRWVPC